jgi:hypothetical protein
MVMCGGFVKFAPYLFWLSWIQMAADFTKCDYLLSLCDTADWCFENLIAHNDTLTDQDFINVAQASNGGVAFGPFLNFAIDGVIDSLGWSPAMGFDTDLAGACRLRSNPGAYYRSCSHHASQCSHSPPSAP